MSGNSSYQSTGQPCETPATVQQSFENMKANLKSQFTQLIQGTSDPAQVAALTSQEERMLATMNAQEQHDMTAAAQGCVPPSNRNNGSSGNSSGNNQYPGGSQSSGNNQYPSNSQNGNGQYSGNGQNAGSNPGNSGNPGSNPYSGNNQNSNNGQNSNNTQNPNNSQSNSNSNNNSGSSAQNGSSGSNGQQQPTPQLLLLNPSSVAQGSSVQITLVGQGTHWTNATNVSFGPQVTLQSFAPNPNGTSAVATINVASNASLGSRGVMLMSGTELVGLSSGLTVTAASTQQGSSGTNSLPTRINTGSGFPGGLVMAGMLTGVSPATNNGQQNVTVTLTGQHTNFANGATTVSFVRASQPGSTNINPQLHNAVLAGLHNTTSAASPLQVGPINVTSTTTAIVPLTINLSAAAGTYNATVTTPTANGTETLTLNNVFTVTSTPALSVANSTPAAVGNVTAAPTSGNYRVTITGLMCGKAASSDDAIYAAAVVRQYDRHSGQSTMLTNTNTWVYGDVNGMIGQRIQAGSRGPMGGIGDGDFVPTGFMPTIKDTLPPQSNLFPMNVWQGTLTDGVDAVVISPSLWINYGDRPIFANWNQNEDSFTNSLLLDSKVQNQINTQTLGALFLGASENVLGSQAQAAVGDVAQAIVDTLLVIPFVDLKGLTHDRPLGLTSASSDPTSATILPNATLVLTREMIEKRLGSNAWTMTAFDFKDSSAGFGNLPGSDRPGEYTMFIQIERQ